jgi:alpha-glucosidase (family GH31 glycosyl hydrolase)
MRDLARHDATRIAGVAASSPRVLVVLKLCLPLVVVGCGTRHAESAAGLSDAAPIDAAVPAALCVDKGVAVPASERVPNGHPLLPPKWALGVLWGSYYDQVGSTYAQGGNILDAAVKLRAEYSGDLLWLDSSWLWHDYADGGPYYVCFQFDPTVFPDPQGMVQTLQQSHFHFGVWEWPWMGHGCQYFQTAVDNRYFVMNGAGPALATGGWHGDPTPAAFDFTSPAAVSWWTGLNEPLAEWGLDFMKLDTTGDPPEGGALADPDEAYRLAYHQAAYELTKRYAAAHDPRAMANGARGFVLPKSATPGNDQIPGYWTDDTNADWSGLTTEMARASALDTSSTAAYWCGDTGGYSNVPTDELYIRWLEYTAFTPLEEFFGAKSPGIGARFPWLFGAQAQAIEQQYTALRYRLLPFRYSNAIAAYEESPVAYPVSWVGATQLLVGSGSSQLLVQPVTTPGATSATVLLPAGADWIDYWTGTSYAGGAAVTVPAPIDQEPIFVKAGSIIPMGPTLHWVDEVPADPLTLDIYPAGSTGYTLYEDDGVSEGYLGGAYATTKVTSDDSSGHPTIAVGAQTTAKYTFAGQLCARTYVLEIHDHAAPTAVTRDGIAEPTLSSGAFEAAAEGWYYDASAAVVWVKFRIASTTATKVSL